MAATSSQTCQASATPITGTARWPRFTIARSAGKIYFCVIPFILLDLFVVAYQGVCFPLNGIPKVRRRDYLIFDRGRLSYLNAIEKLGCVYCSYANGLLGYVREIAARTEQHFCPIKHDDEVRTPHSRYLHFLPYGDAAAYRNRVDKVRDAFANVDQRPGGPNQ